MLEQRALVDRGGRATVGLYERGSGTDDYYSSNTRPAATHLDRPVSLLLAPAMTVALLAKPTAQDPGHTHHSSASAQDSSADPSGEAKIEEGPILPPTPPADISLPSPGSPSRDVGPALPPSASPFKRLRGWRLVVVEAR